jgi:hypothetical protein
LTSRVSLEAGKHAQLGHRETPPALQVLASYGHVRDLPAKAGSVQPDRDFHMLWEKLRAARPRLKEIAHTMKQAQTLILATDPDREGEAIAWHIQDELAVGLLTSQASTFLMCMPCMQPRCRRLRRLSSRQRCSFWPQALTGRAKPPYGIHKDSL